ncbi:MAG: hypothetical protein ACR2JB_16145, partial [Bryobacteraceae bacterium]
ARRSAAALALDPIPASKVLSDPLEFAEFDKHNFRIRGIEEAFAHAIREERELLARAARRGDAMDLWHVAKAGRDEISR